VTIRLARATFVCALVVTALGAGVLTFGTAPAAAQTACWRQVINDWVKNDRVPATYPLHCYRQAIAHVPNDLRQYSSIEEDILAARQQAARRGSRFLTAAGSPNQQNQNRDPQSGIYNQAIDSLSPTNADSMPLPLLILAGLSLILMTAGGAGLVTKRVRARKVPS
jgi:hypothetical protein